MKSRSQIILSGLVQGVGMRPHVYRVAKQLALTGWVRNTAIGVLIEVQGEQVHLFLQTLLAELPPLARIDKSVVTNLALLESEYEFQILESLAGDTQTLIPPDVAICNACLQELFNPNSRYFLYPFVNCIQCGPRYSISRSLPYDRLNTSMREFNMCAACAAEYADPNNRRFHAEPIACAACGPQLSASIDSIAAALHAGKIVALQGVGGYQLICDATNTAAIAKLRRFKQRETKPFAIMALNINSLASIVQTDAVTEQYLLSGARPIVLIPKNNITILTQIAPELSHLGIMLPATALHYCLFHNLLGKPEANNWWQNNCAIPLLVTSANNSSDPIIIDAELAQTALANVADLVVDCNRQIYNRVDDSVLRVINNKACFIRRARGYVPNSIELANTMPATLALGAQSNNTICITRGAEAFISQHIGDLTSRATIKFYHETLEHLLKYLNIKPEIIAHDLHPNFYTTQLAASYNLPTIAVQHHHAHIATVAAENHTSQPVLGLALDGYGYGVDGQAWGGELFLYANNNFERLAHFAPLPLLGNDAAAREPWRMAASVLHCLNRGAEIKQRFAAQPLAHQLADLLTQNSNNQYTTSCGRLFDAASALLGINLISQYAAQAPMQLESLVTTTTILNNGWDITAKQFNLLPCLGTLTQMDAISGANIFHGTLIAGLCDWVSQWAQKTQCNTVILGGGCFLNKMLSEGLIKQLSICGITALCPINLPPGDGGLALGQAWVAGNSLE